MTRKSKTKVALVTGGAKRIGKALCLTLADLGYDVALHYNRSVQASNSLKKALSQKGVTCRIFQADLTDPRQASILIKSVKKAGLNVDVLINNASIFVKDRLSNTTERQFDRHFNVHVKTPYFLTQAFSKAYKKGHIINILDTKVAQNKTEHFSYLLSKKALSELTRMSAVELAPKIRVNAIAPGLILPPENKSNLYLDRRAKDIPLGRRGSINNLTQTLEFLIRNDYLTGQVISVDGGEHLLI